MRENFKQLSQREGTSDSEAAVNVGEKNNKAGPVHGLQARLLLFDLLGRVRGKLSGAVQLGSVGVDNGCCYI